MKPVDASSQVDPCGRVDDLPGGAAAAISDTAGSILRRHTGRGPTETHTTIDRGLVVVLMRGSLSRSEAALADVGDAAHASVMAMRRSYQDAMRAELVAEVERLTGRTVEAFMSTNRTTPDYAAEIFVLKRP